MEVTFFEPSCEDKSDLESFGICDNPPPPHLPAYLSKNIAEKPNWILEIENSKRINIQFIAIDNCIDLRKADGKMESRCDCLITHEDTIVFIELKDRLGRGWLSKAKLQVENTISIFERNHNSNIFKHKKVLIANKQRPFFHASFQTIIEEIKLNTGGYIADVNAKYIVE